MDLNQNRELQISGARTTSTTTSRSHCTPQPRAPGLSGECSRSQWALPDLNRDLQILVGTSGPNLNREIPRPPAGRTDPCAGEVRQCPCQKECQNSQIEYQRKCQDRCQKGRQIGCQSRCQIECQNIRQIKWQTECQIECQKICQNLCQVESHLVGITRRSWIYQVFKIAMIRKSELLRLVRQSWTQISWRIHWHMWLSNHLPSGNLV